MNLSQDLHRMGGAARIHTLYERGYSPKGLRLAVDHGLVFRPRKGWVALPSLGPELRFAVQYGVVLTCTSVAQFKELWVAKPPQRFHVSARHAGAHVSAPAIVHWSAPIVPRHPDALVEPLPNMLHHVSRCLPHEEALAVWESALNKRLTTIDYLSGLPFPPLARALLRECTPYSDSGLESLFKTRLRWLGVPVRAQISLKGHRVDFLIGDRLVIQLDGKQHAGAQKTTDNQHDIALRQDGYHVLRFTYAQVMHD